MRERTRGYVLLLVSVIGLGAEIVSTIQDGIGAPKVVALACFGFLFWWGWSLATKVKPKDKDQKVKPKDQ